MKTMPTSRIIPAACIAVALLALGTAAPADAAAPADVAPPAPAPAPAAMPVSLTPKPGPQPRINGPKVFGVRPGAPFVYNVPATGDRPMTFGATGLPKGLRIDPATGRITGSLSRRGEHAVTLFAGNALGTAFKKFRIVVGDDILLTPPMGWNSWNCWHLSIDQEKILHAARAMAASGLSQHGWTYINIDDTWQGARGGPFNAIQASPKSFPDLPGLINTIHGLGLKAGIYSTPWVTSYDGHVGGSSENPQGTWDRATMTQGMRNHKILPFAIGQYHFFTNDANQWAAWGIDYVKFDWDPNELPETKEMYDALRASGRDIALSLSNNGSGTLFKVIPDISQCANSWRTAGDIGDTWGSIQSEGFGQDKWASYNRPGHWNDPDMLEVGANGGGSPKRLTPDEQYTHISQWCLLSAPLLLGCDLDYLDPFTLGLLTNDEVLDVDQDTLGKQATLVASQGRLNVFAKPLDDGTWAVGFFNRGETESPVSVKWSDLKLTGRQTVRDLWRQKTLGVFTDTFEASVAPHGVVLVKVSPVK